MLEIERPRCPKCNRKLYYRKSVLGYVCKNWQCENYWKLGIGPYFVREDGELREKTSLKAALKDLAVEEALRK